MNTSVQGIIVNNCQYAPIYLIQDPATTQANTYVFATNNVQQPKPICNNLKSFYENSGNIENGLVNVDAAVKPTVAKKKDSILIGNNLKLASFLLPKNDNVNKQYFVENVDIKPQINTSMSNGAPANQPVNIVPKIDMDRKIVKVKDIPVMNRARPDKLLPKIKPKESPPSPNNQSKFTAVQLVNVGGTYHSLNQLNKEQMKIVNQALKMFKDPDKTATERTNETTPNPKYLYKVVSPKDLRIVGQKKYVVKEKKVTKIPRRVEERPRPRPRQQDDAPDLPEAPAETKFTRSGRKVKLPKQIVPEDSPHKVKKKAGTIVSCFQCSAEFGSLYRLQKHYEQQPAHVGGRAHRDLLACLAGAVRGDCAGGVCSSDGTGTGTGIGGEALVRHVRRLVAGLRARLPCLLRPEPCATVTAPTTVPQDVASVFGITPGKYYIDVDALNCVKDQDGFCVHNPPKTNQCNKDKSSAQETLSPDSESENCARINSVTKWPTVSKRIWKKKTHETTAKKMRLKSEGDALIDLETEEVVFTPEERVPSATVTADDDISELLENKQQSNVAASQPVLVSDAPAAPAAELNKPKNNYVQFHSAHFDIRSSPIKSSSTVFRKFQINPSKMSNYQVPVIRSLEMLDKADNKQVTTSSSCEPSSHVPMSTSDNSVLVTLPASTTNSFHGTIPGAKNRLHDTLHRSENVTNVTLANSNTDLHISLPVSVSDMHVKLPSPNNDLHLKLPNIDNNLPGMLPNNDIDLQVPISSNDNSLDISLTNTENSLHDIFKGGVDLACKEDSNIDSDLKDWIISTSEKSQHSLKSFTKTDESLIEPEFLHVSTNEGRCSHKSVSHNIDLPSLDETDNRLLTNQGESVLNFLDNLSNDLVYPETEIRNNSVDFQLDLFTFHNSV